MKLWEFAKQVEEAVEKRGGWLSIDDIGVSYSGEGILKGTFRITLTYNNLNIAYVIREIELMAAQFPIIDFTIERMMFQLRDQARAYYKERHDAKKGKNDD